MSPRSARPRFRRWVPPIYRIGRIQALRTVGALMLREMATTYGRSPGGYLWAVLEPALGILLLTIIFSVGFRSPPLGTSFPIFYATGLVPFMAYSDISGKVSQSINFSRPLLAYPRITFMDAILARFILNYLTQLLVAYVIFAGIILLFDSRVQPDPEGILIAFALMAALSFGIGVLNCFLLSMFPIWQRVWGIGSRTLFLISGIFFLVESIPEPYRTFLLYNPIVHLVGQMRRAFYPGYDAPYVDYGFVIGVSLATTLLGLICLRRFHRHILNF